MRKIAQLNLRNSFISPKKWQGVSQKEFKKKKKEFKHGKFVNAYKRKKINELKIKKYKFVDCFDVRKTNNFSVTPDQ